MTEIKFSMLEVDLTGETSRVIDVTEDVKKYLGARGLANKLIWDLVPQGADALSPDIPGVSIKLIKKSFPLVSCRSLTNSRFSSVIV